jgi:hypothetical protein
MAAVPQRLVFNTRPPDQPAATHATQRQPAAQTLYIPDDDPQVELEVDSLGILESSRGDGYAKRVDKQLRRIGTLAASPLTYDPFGTALDWAYRCYKVVRPAGAAAEEWPFRDYLYLFNVLVALEWEPSKSERQRLAWAFRRASDFLFDVTDGGMALGQVVCGGPELMAGADIQIMASTRLHPRSWVGALHPTEEYQHDEKFIPIRIGRGLWSDVRHGTIPWEEPEGYRIIVHEFGHYALKLIDEYLETRQVFLPDNTRAALASEQSLVRPAPTTVVLLKVATTADSIMATTEGTSELVSDQWHKLHALFPSIREDRSDKDVRPGPNRLPLPLPYLRRTQASEHTDKAQQFFPRWDSGLKATLGRFGMPSDIPLDRCWVYVVQGMTEQHPAPARVIAQGTLEDRAAVTPFPLLGAAVDDTVVLIGDQRDSEPVVLCARLDKSERLSWRRATPPAFPAIDIIPVPVSPNTPRADVRIRLSYLGSQVVAPEQIWVFPLGQMPGQDGILVPGPYGTDWLSEPIELPTLDGNVLLRWGDGALLLGSFSQGGDGPNSGFPWPANPINAGSADGNALIFMYKEHADDRPPNDIKMVTTMARGLPEGPTRWRDRSATFGIASNQPLPPSFTPTLMLYYDVFGEQEPASTDGGDLLICRWTDGAWRTLPTYLPPGFRFAVAPLDLQAGGTLINPEAKGPRVEYYKVCWVPRAS